MEEDTMANNIAKILQSMASFQQQMDNIKRTCAENGNKCSADLDAIKTNLAGAEEARQKDHLKLQKIGKDLSKTNQNLDLTNTNLAEQAQKLQLVDNVSNKNKETISNVSSHIFTRPLGVRQAARCGLVEPL